MSPIEIIRQAWESQYKARTRYYSSDETKAFERARKMTMACLRYSNKLSEIAPYPGEFEIDDFIITRRKVDEIDNIYARLKS